MSILELEKSTTVQFLKKGQSQYSDDIYQTFFNYFPDTIYTMDLQGNILSCNNNKSINVI